MNPNLRPSPPLDATERLRAENALFRYLASADVETNPSGALEEVLSSVIDITGADRGMIGLFSDTRSEPVWWVARGRDTRLDAFSRSVVRGALQTRRAVRESNLSRSAHSRALSVRRHRMRQVLCAPLGRHRPLGALYLQDLRGGKLTYSDDDLALVTAISRFLGPFVERLLQGAPSTSAVDSLDHTHEIRDRLRGHEALIGTSQRFATTLEEVFYANLFDEPLESVLLLGASGVGKTAVARLVHLNSGRGEGPFVAVNCANLGPDRAEQELFGVLARVFTGVGAQAGLLEAANGGTLFLDEVGELSAECQAKLLTVMETGRFRPLGATEERQVDVRLLAATNRDVDELLADGRLRRDFHARLAQVVIRIPSLSERTEDIPALAEHLLRGIGGKRFSLSLDADAARRLASRDWPANIRELENHLRQAARQAVRSRSSVVTAEHFGHLPATGGRAAGSLEQGRLAAERRELEAALKQAGGNKTRAAELLGIARSHLYRLLERHDVGDRET